jgi:hypothetical protein
MLIHLFNRVGRGSQQAAKLSASLLTRLAKKRLPRRLSFLILQQENNTQASLSYAENIAAKVSLDSNGKRRARGTCVQETKR